VLVVHGYAEHGGRYRHVAERLTESDLSVVVPDLRGHGRSGGRPVSVSRFDDYIDDLHQIASEAERMDGRLPVILLGHSMGGLIAAVYAVRHESELRGLALSAPAVVTGRIPPVTRAVGRLLARVAPEAGVLKLPWEKLSRDPAVLVAHRADPWVHRHRIRARLGAEMLRAIDDVAAGLPRLTVPVLVMQGTADAIVDPSAAPYVDSRVGSADRTVRQYPGLYHEILNEPERARVLDDLMAWIEARLAVAPPSRAEQGFTAT